MIPLHEAQAAVLAACPPPRAAAVPVGEASGCVLSAPAVAALDVPPFANSAMDGYAVRSADVSDAPVTLDVVGRVLAGSAPGPRVGPGEAVRIMTGAPLPEGADAVCMVERTRIDGDPGAAPDGPHKVVVETPLGPGDFVRPAGDDVRAGEVVLDAGRTVGPTQLAALVSAGCAEVAVFRRVRVGVMSTGDELVEAGTVPGPAQIPDSNRPMLLGLVAEAGATALDLGRCGDDEAELAGRIEHALGRVDAVVLSGGVSVGDVDVVRMVLDRMGGGETRWMQIAIRPAKPFSFTVLPGPHGPVPVFGLPGNPVSSAVSFELLVRPALRAMAGHARTGRPRVRAVAAEPLRRRRDGKLHLVRVRLDPASGTGPAAGAHLEARPSAGQGSHQIRSLAIADGLALVPDGDGVEQGATVEVMVTDAHSLDAPDAS